MNSPEQVQVEEVPVTPAEPTIGEQLSAARQAQHLSLTDVANRLKLSIQQVQALEQGDYDRLPGAVFVRGFARNYARLLNLDPEATVRAIEAQLPRTALEQGRAAPEANIPMPARTSNRWPVAAGVLAVVFLGAALVDVLWPESPSAPQTTEPSDSAATAGAIPPTGAAAPEPAVAPLAAQPAQQTAQSEPPAAVPAAYQPATAAGARPLRFVFEQASWVQVRDASGQVVLEALYPAGTSRDIDVTPPVSLVIGNAPGVRLTYGDRAVDLAPHTRTAVARLNLE